MENRWYFFVGDIVANLTTGVVAGVACWLLVGPEWNMWLAMIIAMALGMLVAGLLFIPFSILFGAMEVMVPIMLSGMLAGMVVGMWCAMSAVSLSGAVFVGGASGLVGLAVVWGFHLMLRGRVELARGGQ